MANMSLEKVKMPEQEPNIRNKNFKEVALGYTEEMAKEEAERCLNCKNKPCVNGCHVNVQALMIKFPKQVHFLQSAEEFVLRKTSVKNTA